MPEYYPHKAKCPHRHVLSMLTPDEVLLLSLTAVYVRAPDSLAVRCSYERWWFYPVYIERERLRCFYCVDDAESYYVPDLLTVLETVHHLADRLPEA